MLDKQSHKILVVEDEGILALDTMQLLESSGYQVLGHASTADQAVEMALGLKPDLILMDIHLDGKRDGIDAATEITNKFEIPIIFVTAHAEEETLRRAKGIKPYGYIIKPFEEDELRATVQMALSRINALEEEPQDEIITFGQIEDVESLAVNLNKIPLFATLDNYKLKELAALCTIKNIESDTMIASPEQSNCTPFMILRGRMNLSRVTYSGKELVIDLLVPGDSFGVIRALTPSTSQSQIRTVSDCEVCFIPSSGLNRIVESEASFWKKVHEESIVRYEQSVSLAVGLAHSRVETRILSALTNLAPKMGKSLYQKNLAEGQAVRLFLTRRELADLTATTPETAIRVTKALEREGYLDLTRPGIIKIPNIAKLISKLQDSYN